MSLNLHGKRPSLPLTGRRLGVVVCLLITLCGPGLVTLPPAVAAEPGLFTGELNGAAYKIEFPAAWKRINLKDCYTELAWQLLTLED